MCFKGILFPGQGSQSIGMLQDFESTTIVRDTLNEGSDVLGYDLWKTFLHDPQSQLDQTAVTQPCLLAASIALWRYALSNNRLSLSDIAYLAGHSLGEYSALVAAQALSFKDALILVSHRGRLMQSAVGKETGAMSAIMGLSQEVIMQLCQQVIGDVQPANFNSPMQTVVSGEREAVLQLNVLAKAQGAKLVKLLAVSVPSHSQLMAPIVPEFMHYLQEVSWLKPNLSVINNVDVAIYTDKDSIISGLARQLTGAVHWYESIESMVAKGVTHFAECGPGRVLAGLNKRIVKDYPVADLSDIKGSL
jgi:[acyl-carrier-protein] S-malonyltransferase